MDAPSLHQPSLTQDARLFSRPDSPGQSRVSYAHNTLSQKFALALGVAMCGWVFVGGPPPVQCHRRWFVMAPGGVFPAAVVQAPDRQRTLPAVRCGWRVPCPRTHSGQFARHVPLRWLVEGVRPPTSQGSQSAHMRTMSHPRGGLTILFLSLRLVNASSSVCQVGFPTRMHSLTRHRLLNSSALPAATESYAGRAGRFCSASAFLSPFGERPPFAAPLLLQGTTSALPWQRLARHLASVAVGCCVSPK